MNNYNKRFLKNILEDLREENDKIFLAEIESAANEPNFANTDSDRSRFKRHLKKISSKRARKTFLKVASVFLAILLGATITTLSVKSLREKLFSFFSNKNNDSYSLIISSESTGSNEFAAYEGQYIPTYIPDGYTVSSIENSKTFNMITFSDSSDHIISYSEFGKDFESKIHLDKESFDTYEVKTIDGCQTTLASKDGIYHVLKTEVDAIIYITFNDAEIDFFGFASYIDKK